MNVICFCQALTSTSNDLECNDSIIHVWQAMKDTARDPDFCVVARVEALIAGWSIDEALKRADAFLEAGVYIFLWLPEIILCSLGILCCSWQKYSLFICCFFPSLMLMKHNLYFQEQMLFWCTVNGKTHHRLKSSWNFGTTRSAVLLMDTACLLILFILHNR